jgi:DNA repair photolyase
MTQNTITGRGAGFNPPNRFEELKVEKAPDDLAQYFEDPDPEHNVLTKFYIDHTKSILAKNDSPDLGFTYSLNPYRGCEHGCIYCYARPTHEYLGFSAGLDFETKILVKPDAARLLEQQFRSEAWQPQVVLLSGNTDCYQPIERRLGITRQCLHVFLKHRNPVSIITKNALIERDVDVLRELTSLNLVFVIITITTLDPELARRMEPRTTTPAKRLDAIEVLAKNGIPVGVNIGPVIPGLNDVEIPMIVKQAAERGARYASHTLVRLPLAVKDLFIEWLDRTLPDQSARILNRIRSVRGGRLTCSEFGKRMKGEGKIADVIDQLFHASCKQFRLNEQLLNLSIGQFRREESLQMKIL